MVWRRKKSIVDFRNQFWFSLELLAITIGFIFLCLFIMFYTPISSAITGQALDEVLLQELLETIFLQWPAVFLGLAILVMWGMLMSHRLWGSLYGLERAVKAWRGGDHSVRIRFRKTDYLHPTKDFLNAFFEEQDNLYKKVQEHADELKNLVDENNQGKAQEKIRELSQLLKVENDG